MLREELLVRMLDAHGDIILPAMFLPTAERFGMVEEIDLIVLELGIELVRQGRAVAINVSAHTLGDARYIPILERALTEGLEASHFNFELTETAAVANLADVQHFAARLREFGCSLCLDDFGTGFGPLTLTRVRKLGVDYAQGFHVGGPMPTSSRHSLVPVLSPVSSGG